MRQEFMISLTVLAVIVISFLTGKYLQVPKHVIVKEYVTIIPHKVIVDSLSIWGSRISNDNNIHMPIGKAYLLATDGVVTDTLNMIFEEFK